MEQSGPRTDVESKQDLTARSRSEYSQDSTNDGYRRSGQRQRNESLHVSYSAEDVQRMAKEISEETIAPVHLSLLGWWIREKTEHYELAKSFIRELSLDQGYSVMRIKSECLRELLVSTQSVRPMQAVGKITSKNAPTICPKEIATTPDPLNVPTHAKFEVLPSSLRRRPERLDLDSQQSSPLSAPTREYPPNTPDRPQPLVFSGKHSGNSSFAPTPSANRSVSEPLARTKKANRRGIIPFPRDSVGLEEITSQLSLLTVPNDSSKAHSDRADTDDVFGIIGNEQNRYSDPFDLVNAISTLEKEELFPDDTSAEDQTEPQQGQYEPRYSQPSSKAGYSEEDNLRSSSFQQPFDAPSVLESESTGHGNEDRTQYSFDAPASTSGLSLRRHAGKVRSQTSRWAQTFLFGSRPNIAAGDFYRPILFPTSGAFTGTHSTATGTQSSVVDENDLAPTHDLNEEPDYDDLDSTALAMHLANFPLPPLSNPVNSLPMLISRATSPHYCSTPTSELVTQIRLVLADTRAHGEQLPLEDWNTMSPFERSWREVNEELLIWIYRRQDTWLSPEDVESVDCVAREVRANMGHWVVEVLREEAEMF